GLTLSTNFPPPQSRAGPKTSLSARMVTFGSPKRSLTKFLRSCRVTPRREKTLTSEEYFKELWRVLTPYPEAKTFVRDWMRETIARREVRTHVERTGSLPEDP